MCATFRAMSCDEKQSNKVGNATSKIVYIFCSRLSFQAIKQKKKLSKHSQQTRCKAI